MNFRDFFLSFHQFKVGVRIVHYSSDFVQQTSKHPVKYSFLTAQIEGRFAAVSYLYRIQLNQKMST